MTNCCKSFYLNSILALLALPALSWANTEPTSDPIGNPIFNPCDTPKLPPIVSDSIALPLLGHCNPITVVEVDCNTKTIQLSAFILFTFSGQHQPVMVNWNTGEYAHKITVVPPGFWSWDPTFSGCEPNHWQNTYEQPGSFFQGNLQILSPGGLCATGSTVLEVETGGYNFINYGWNPPNPANALSPYEIVSPGQYVLSVTDDLGCPFTEQINIPAAPPAAPTYSLSTPEKNLSVCTGSDAHFTANLVPFCGFNSPVTLSLTGAPPGASVHISANPVMPPSAVEITISGINTPGNYILTVTAVGGGVTQAATVGMTVSPGLSGMPSAISPVNGGTGINTTTLLQWTAVTNADSYLVQVATNPSFSAGSLVFTQVVSATNTWIYDLQEDTVFYWRVRAGNECESGDYSSVFAFQTYKKQCYGKALFITPVPFDNSTANFGLGIPFNGVIYDVSVGFTIGHTYTGDLSARLISPSFDIALLFDRPGVPATTYGCDGDNVSLSFSNSGQAADILENQCNYPPPSLSGNFQPIQSFDIFNGKNSNGTWTLSFTDHFPGDEAFVSSIQLNVCVIEPIIPGNILTNSPLIVNSNGSGIIGMSKLKMETTGTLNQGKFILLSLPQHGILYLNGIPLEVGDIFSQSDINNNLLVYNNICDGALADNFHFDALDENNDAWVHDGIFYININPNSFTATAFQSSPILCHGGATGSITITTNPLNGIYNYRLNGGAPQSSNVFSGLPAGTYTIIATDHCGFTASASITLSNPPAISVSALVAGDDVTVNASGGSGILEYSLNGALFQTSNLFQNLCNGVYTITVRDGIGCTATASATVSAGASPQAIISNTQSTCVGQNFGSASVSVSGGVPPYTYFWSNAQTGQTAFNLSVGAYSVTVTGANGCTTVATANVAALPAPNLTLQLINGCFGFGSISAIGQGGVPPYTYLWSNGQTSATINNLNPGNYSVTITGANGCANQQFATVLPVNDPPVVSVTNTIPACPGQSNGSATILVSSGGIPPYAFNWSNGATTQNISNLFSGTYTVTVTSVNGCTSTVSASIGTSNPPIPTINNTIPACAGQSNGSATVVASGGVSPYSFLWSNGQTGATAINLPAGTYKVTVTGGNGCTASVSAIVGTTNPPMPSVSNTSPVCVGQSNGSATVVASGGVSPYSFLWSNGQTNSTATNLPAGTYTVTVTGNNGCSATISAVIVNFNPPISGISNIVSDCSGQSSGSATVVANGGVSPFSYLWNNGQTGATATNLAAGTYTVTVTDGNGCTSKATAIIGNSEAPIAGISNTIPPCTGQANGSTTVVANGGILPYSYLWSNGQTSATATQLAAGIFNVTITGGNGCTASATAILVDIPVFSISLQTSLETGGLSCQSTVTTLSGTAPFSYTWNNGATSQSAFNLPGGAVSVTVTDATGCTTTQTGSCTVSANDIEGLESFSVRPNPANTHLFIQIGLADLERVQIKLFNSLGQTMFESNHFSSYIEEKIELQDFPEGCYFLQVSTKAGRKDEIISIIR